MPTETIPNSSVDAITLKRVIRDALFSLEKRWTIFPLGLDRAALLIIRKMICVLLFCFEVNFILAFHRGYLGFCEDGTTLAGLLAMTVCPNSA